MKKPDNSRKKAVFLDRDGTIIADLNYLKDPEQVRPLSGIGEALGRLRRSGFSLVMVSNQSGIGRGLMTRDQVDRVNRRLMQFLESHNVTLDKIYYCPHAPEEQCVCRKPSPEMIFQAARDLDLDLSQCFMVGDKASDMEAGKRAGCRTILLQADPDGEPDDAAELSAADWRGVVAHILEE